MTLVIRLLGPVHISRDDQPIQMRGYQPLALLAYLLLTGQAHTRQHLVDLLFDRADDPRASLRWSLSELRRAIGGGYLMADRQEVAFNFDSDYWLDVPAFEAGQFELYRGDFLEGLRLREVFQFEDWVFFERERLRGHYQTTLAQHLAVLERQGDDAAVVEIAHRLLRLDNLREEWYRALIQAYARLGQREAALAQFELCRQVLQAELGLEPGPETVTLVEAILKGRGVISSSAPLHLRPPPPSYNLPPQPTPFIGREKELADIARRLKDPACRLLTLVGPGGIGKTRLAIQAAQTFIDRPPAEATFAHGILFVPLTPISSPSGIVSAIAEAANFTFYNNVPPQQQLLDYLREKEMLVVLDNFEQLLTAPEEENAGGVNLIAEILAVAPAVKLLVTSREGLKMQEEWLYPLQGLDLPAGDRAETEAALAEYSAIRLFVQSARRVQPNFSAAAEAEEMLRICRLVEGMPLGIELAAAWLKVLPCAKIAAEIEGSLDFLSSSVRNVPARHRSMRAVFEQSWQRLSETEQAVLRQLSVFRGGFRRKAAGAVAGASLPALAGLVDKSLISLTPGGRYHLHELLRQFSGDKLVEAPPEQAATRERHSAYFLAFLQERTAGLTGKQPKAVLDEIQAEVENVRAAWNWAVEQGQVVALDRALDSLYQFYWTRSHFQEGEEIFRQAAKWLQSETRKGQLSAIRKQEAGVSDQASKIANRLLARQGAFYTALGDFDLARELLQNSLALARRWEAQVEIVFCLNILGLVAFQQGDYVAADPLYRESLTISQTMGHHLGMAETLERLGMLTSIMGDYLTAQNYLQQGLDLLREIENRAGMASMLDNLGANAFDSGDYTASEQYYQECLALSKEIGNQLIIAQAVGGLGLVAWGRGGAKLSEARQLLEESLTICREIGHRFFMQVYLTLLGGISNRMSRYEEGQRYFQAALDLSKQIGPMYNAIQILAGLGETALGLENLQAARRYLLEALETPGSIPDILGAMVSWAMLLKKEADVRSAGNDTTSGIHPAAGRAASQEVPANPEQKKQAVEILSLVLDHSASRQIHKDKAASLLAELEAELPLEVVATAKTRAKSRTLDEVVADILQAA